jgi:hypothetical protein
MSGRDAGETQSPLGPPGRCQQPLQMLISRSRSLSRGRMASWADERRNSRRDKIAARLLTLVTIGIDRGDGRLETIGGAEGTTGTDMFGDGSG